MDKFWQPGKSSEGIGIGFSCGVLRKEAFSEDLFGEVEETRIAESGSKKRIPGYSDEVQTGTEFTEEVCDQINQEISRAALIEYENSGIRKLLTEEKKSLSGVLSLVDHMSIMLRKWIMYCHQSLSS